MVPCPWSAKPASGESCGEPHVSAEDQPAQRDAAECTECDERPQDSTAETRHEAVFNRHQGDFAHALEFYERALSAYRSADVDLATRELDEERAEFALLRGDAIKARALIESLIEPYLHEANQVLQEGTGTTTLREAWFLGALGGPDPQNNSFIHTDQLRLYTASPTTAGFSFSSR